MKQFKENLNTKRNFRPKSVGFMTPQRQKLIRQYRIKRIKEANARLEQEMKCIRSKQKESKRKNKIVSSLKRR